MLGNGQYKKNKNNFCTGFNASTRIAVAIVAR